jgi:hypothetical protein
MSVLVELQCGELDIDHAVVPQLIAQYARTTMRLFVTESLWEPGMQHVAAHKQVRHTVRPVRWVPHDGLGNHRCPVDHGTERFLQLRARSNIFGTVGNCEDIFACGEASKHGLLKTDALRKEERQKVRAGVVRGAPVVAHEPLVLTVQMEPIEERIAKKIVARSAGRDPAMIRR